MKIRSRISAPKGRVSIPPSKSHSIRSLFFATLADGNSRLEGRLRSDDVDSAIKACQALGAVIQEDGDVISVEGTNGVIKPLENLIDVGNSGTTARFLLSLASLSPEPITIKGDESTSRRPMRPLLDALKALGANVKDESGKGLLPLTISGPIIGGNTIVDGTTSQYLSSLLVHTPFCKKETCLLVGELNEKPYVEMTLEWMKRLGIKFERDEYRSFTIPPNQKIDGFNIRIPADFSSATFFLALAAIEGAEVELEGLDLNDSQGDKKVIDYLKDMGADIEVGDTIKVRGKKLKGITIDMNSTPDALPAMAVIGCLADGITHLTNVPQARIKETDRIAVMAREMAKMGAEVQEEPDGLIIKGGTLKGAKVDGHHDHRVVMSLAIAGFVASGVTEISTAEAIKITFPNFVELMRECGADISME